MEKNLPTIIKFIGDNNIHKDEIIKEIANKENKKLKKKTKWEKSDKRNKEEMKMKIINPINIILFMI